MNEISLPKTNVTISSNKKLDQNIKTDKNAKLSSEPEVKTENTSAVVYESSKNEAKLNNYDKKGHIYNKARIDEMKAESDSKLNELKEAVKAMMEAQGYKFEDIMRLLNDPDSVTEDGKLIDKDGNEVIIKIDDETRQNALEAISEDGYYGVKQTSQRMIEFAKTISGNDPSKLEEIKKAITEGFKAAEEIFGGELPEISHKTFDAVMKGLDEWAGISE